MGAYYECCLKDKRYNVYHSDNGAKLMEYSYIGNTYVDTMMGAILGNIREVSWVCDYHEEDDNCQYTWENTKPIEEYPLSVAIKSQDYFIINHSKDIYIDIKQLVELLGGDEDELMIHPIPILCNSDEDSQGGGDYHIEDSRRATWCGDLISTGMKRPEIFTNVTEDCIFKEV